MPAFRVCCAASVEEQRKGSRVSSARAREVEAEGLSAGGLFRDFREFVGIEVGVYFHI